MKWLILFKTTIWQREPLTNSDIIQNKHFCQGIFDMSLDRSKLTHKKMEVGREEKELECYTPAS